jgi:CheY-like chemotaxis protein
MKPETRINIIVANDNAQAGGVLSEIVTEQSHTVRTAIDGNADLSGFRECVPDVLVTDLEMPGMSGFDLIPLVRQPFSRVAFIAMSGAYTPDNVPRCVVSDEFYPKGSGSITLLLDMLARARSRQGLVISLGLPGNSL